MKLIVTGGAGFIGSNFIAYWLGRHPNDEIVNVDKLTYAGDLGNLSGINKNGNYTFVKCDINDRNTVAKFAKDSDAIVNFAAESHVDNSIDNSEKFIHSNFNGVHSLLELSRKFEVRLHQVSTDEVYGALKLNSTEKFSEKSCYNPRNPYSATKAAADFLVRAYFNTYKVPVTISNCSNNFGPNQHPEKLIAKTIMNAMLGRRIPIYGNGAQVRDWIYAEDHCSAVECILKKGEMGETYLVSSNNEINNGALVKKILSKMGKSYNLIQKVPDRPGHDQRYAIDASKIERELGWRPKTTLDRGLDMTIKHYKENFKRYSKKLNAVQK
jgi:dTDP-glucose 4,6-dehydratase